MARLSFTIACSTLTGPKPPMTALWRAVRLWVYYGRKEEFEQYETARWNAAEREYVYRTENKFKAKRLFWQREIRALTGVRMKFDTDWHCRRDMEWLYSFLLERVRQARGEAAARALHLGLPADTRSCTSQKRAAPGGIPGKRGRSSRAGAVRGSCAVGWR